MNDAVKAMLARYQTKSVSDHENALIEVIQKIALLALWRGKFFEHAAFYGGTALRILYGLDRFSEGFDFTLLAPMPGFSLAKYLPFVRNELEAFAFSVEVEAREKRVETPVESAFIKAGTMEHLLKIGVREKVSKQKKLTIKFEIDTDPPPHFTTESKFLFNPVPFSVRTLVPPDLFAGKMHAVLCRGWKNRVKGRDWYDLVWYVQRGIPVHMKHLEARMVQSEHWNRGRAMTERDFRDVLSEKIAGLDVEGVKLDVRPFLRDASVMDIWSREFFASLVDKIRLT